MYSIGITGVIGLIAVTGILVTVVVLLVNRMMIGDGYPMENQSKDDNPKPNGSNLPLATGLGMLFGAIFGTALDQVGTGTALGLCFGAAIGVVLDQKKKK